MTVPPGPPRRCPALHEAAVLSEGKAAREFLVAEGAGKGQQ